MLTIVNTKPATKGTNMDKVKFDKLNAKLKAIADRKEKTGTETAAVIYTRVNAVTIRRRKTA
jgi:hypothetical protein